MTHFDSLSDEDRKALQKQIEDDAKDEAQWQADMAITCYRCSNVCKSGQHFNGTCLDCLGNL